MDVNIYILDFWPWNEVHSIWVIWTNNLQECKGHARVGGPRLWLFRWHPCPPTWRVQLSSGIFRDAPLPQERMGMPTEHICTYPYIYICGFLVCFTIVTKIPLNWALITHQNSRQIISPLDPHMGDVKPLPHELFGEVDLGRGSRQERNANFLDTRLRKYHCPCILEGHLSTSPILSALRLQSPKSNIYVHFNWVNEQLTRISLTKSNHQ